MNLQVSMPYETCPFKCPMCIANGRERFSDMYTENRKEYLSKLKLLAESGKYKDFVITGASDPTLNSHWLDDVLETLKGYHTELQTKNYNIKNYELHNLSVLAYSITNSKEYLQAWSLRKLSNAKNRLVILLTNEFDFLTAKNFNPMGFEQITFKILQMTEDEKTNKWIETNSMTDLTNIYAIVDKFNGDKKVSVRLDASCQDSHGRYEIFRADGKLYNHWENKEGRNI
jgi:organic radical activating enzyme